MDVLSQSSLSFAVWKSLAFWLTIAGRFSAFGYLSPKTGTEATIAVGCKSRWLWKNADEPWAALCGQ